MRLPLHCAWTCSSCWVTALLTARARLPRPARVWAPTTHTTPQSSRYAPAPSSRRVFWDPPRQAGHGRTEAASSPAKRWCHPACWQKAKSGEERTADFKRQWIKRHKGRQINQLMRLWVKKLGCLGESWQVKTQCPPLPYSRGHLPLGF